jgi:hypothetical protein
MRLPVFSERVDVADSHLDLLLFRSQKFKRPNLHGVVLELRLPQDTIAHRQEYVTIMERAVAVTIESVACTPRNSADADGQCLP